MDHPQTPRILAPHLSNFQHRIVRVLGKVVQLRGEQAIIDAGGQIDVILSRVSKSLVLSNYTRQSFSFLPLLRPTARSGNIRSEPRIEDERCKGLDALPVAPDGHNKRGNHAKNDWSIRRTHPRSTHTLFPSLRIERPEQER